MFEWRTKRENERGKKGGIRVVGIVPGMILGHINDVAYKGTQYLLTMEGQNTTVVTQNGNEHYDVDR